MSKETEQLDAENRVLRNIISNLFWLVHQGDFSDSDGDLFIRAAEEEKTTAESAQALIESCGKDMDDIQETAARHLKESTWRCEYLQSLSNALKQSLKLQFQYAEILNKNDGEKRLVLKVDHDCVDKWMEYLGEEQ